MRKLAAVAMLVLPVPTARAGGEQPEAAVRRVAAQAHASAIVVDWQSGVTVAAAGDMRQSAPGSAIKPLLLAYALQHGIVRKDTTVYCRRDLRIAGKSYACTHPADRNIFNAETALAESCNTWFAELGRRFTGPGLDAALDRAHLQHVRLETAGPEQRELAVLGLRGVEVSPLSLALAYRDLLLHLDSNDPVWRGLEESVDYGMANPAKIEGMDLLGKTGTASDPGEFWTHGWFAGGIAGRYIVAIYVPRGDGGDAARLAAQIFRALAQVHAK